MLPSQKYFALKLGCSSCSVPWPDPPAYRHYYWYWYWFCRSSKVLAGRHTQQTWIGFADLSVILCKFFAKIMLAMDGFTTRFVLPTELSQDLPSAKLSCCINEAEWRSHFWGCELHICLSLRHDKWGTCCKFPDSRQRSWLCRLLSKEYWRSSGPSEWFGGHAYEQDLSQHPRPPSDPCRSWEGDYPMPDRSKHCQKHWVFVFLIKSAGSLVVWHGPLQYFTNRRPNFYLQILYLTYLQAYRTWYIERQWAQLIWYMVFGKEQSRFLGLLLKI